MDRFGKLASGKEGRQTFSFWPTAKVRLVEDPDGGIEDGVDADKLVVLDDSGGLVHVSDPPGGMSARDVELEK